MKNNIFLIHGLKYSGKSTLAGHLIDKHGYVRVKMADPLKNMVRSLLRDAQVDESQIEEYVEGNSKEIPIPELNGITPRSLMMTLGDEWRNMHGKDLWLNIVKPKVSKLISDGHKVVIDDIRYDFELEAFDKFEPIKTVIVRGGLHYEPFDETRHPGERPIPIENFDYLFDNNKDTPYDLWHTSDLLLSNF